MVTIIGAIVRKPTTTASTTATSTSIVQSEQEMVVHSPTPSPAAIPIPIPAAMPTPTTQSTTPRKTNMMTRISNHLSNPLHLFSLATARRDNENGGTNGSTTTTNNTNDPATTCRGGGGYHNSASASSISTNHSTSKNTLTEPNTNMTQISKSLTTDSESSNSSNDYAYETTTVSTPPNTTNNDCESQPFSSVKESNEESTTTAGHHHHPTVNIYETTAGESYVATKATTRRRRRTLDRRKKRKPRQRQVTAMDPMQTVSVYETSRGANGNGSVSDTPFQERREQHAPTLDYTADSIRNAGVGIDGTTITGGRTSRNRVFTHLWNDNHNPDTSLRHMDTDASNNIGQQSITLPPSLSPQSTTTTTTTTTIQRIIPQPWETYTTRPTPLEQQLAQVQGPAQPQPQPQTQTQPQPQPHASIPTPTPNPTRFSKANTTTTSKTAHPSISTKQTTKTTPKNNTTKTTKPKRTPPSSKRTTNTPSTTRLKSTPPSTKLRTTPTTSATATAKTIKKQWPSRIRNNRYISRRDDTNGTYVVCSVCEGKGDEDRLITNRTHPFTAASWDQHCIQRIHKRNVIVANVLDDLFDYGYAGRAIGDEDSVGDMEEQVAVGADGGALDTRQKTSAPQQSPCPVVAAASQERKSSRKSLSPARYAPMVAHHGAYNGGTITAPPSSTPTIAPGGNNRVVWDPLPPPKGVPTLPNTLHCTWSYNKTTRVLLAQFHPETMGPTNNRSCNTNNHIRDRGGNRRIHAEDEEFLLKMMEKDDITVVSEGFVGGLDTTLWNLDYINRCRGESYFHKIRVFRQVNDGGDDDDGNKGVKKPTRKRTRKQRNHHIRHKEINGFQSMKTQDYLSYLKRRRSALAASNDVDYDVNDCVGEADPIFQYIAFDGNEKSVNVLEDVLYVIDFDLMKQLPMLYEDMRNSFLLPGLLPGGSHCMMNQVPFSARPFMGPNLYLTPPGAFTHFHQDGHGTVDSGHQCLAGYNEVVMLRRLPDARKKHSLELLHQWGNGDDKERQGKDNIERSYDALYSLPHGDENGEKPPWPSPEAIKECKRLNYCPSVFILKPGQHVHINKGRIHAFRKMSTSILPSSDCHSRLRKALIKEENITSEVVCLSVAWDWMYRGYTCDGINEELESALACAKLSQERKKLSLAITETSLLHLALTTVSHLEQSRSEEDTGRDNENNLISICFSKETSIAPCVPSPATILRGIQPPLKRLIEGHEKSLDQAKSLGLNSNAKRQRKAHQLSLSLQPNALQNPDLFALDAYGDDFFCKTCSCELSNLYMHCDGCEELLKKDFNICTECYSDQKYVSHYLMCPGNECSNSFAQHTGYMPIPSHLSKCECVNNQFCSVCLKCTGCSCICHTRFTLNFRFMTITQEQNLLSRVNANVEATILQENILVTNAKKAKAKRMAKRKALVTADSVKPSSLQGNSLATNVKKQRPNKKATVAPETDDSIGIVASDANELSGIGINDMLEQNDVHDADAYLVMAMLSGICTSKRWEWPFSL